MEEEFEKEFPAEIFKEQFGDYEDHAPAYTHPDGECTCCPVQYWYYDDIKMFISKQLEQQKKEMIDKIKFTRDSLVGDIYYADSVISRFNGLIEYLSTKQKEDK